MKYLFQKLIVLLLVVIIGLPLGLLMASLQFLIVFFRFPLDVYKTAMVSLDRQRELNQADMWTRHIARMEAKKKHN